ncbi:hypothetical protein KAW08_05560 [bacterium]|nr:hypothetical protein [bacterium]
MANGQKFKGIVPALIIVVALGFMTYRIFHKDSYTSRKGVDRIIGIKLGEAFSTYLPEGGKVMVFISEGQESYVKGLKERMFAEDVVIARLEIESEDAMFLEDEYDNKLLEFYNKQLSEHPDISGVIFFSQFPKEARRLNIFLGQNPPKIALLTGMSSQITALIKRGYVQTVVAGTPEVHTVEKGEKIAPEKIFEQRFMIVTTDNLEDVIRKYPQYIRR